MPDRAAYRTDEFAAMIGVKATQVQRWCVSGQVRAEKIGGLWFVLAVEVREDGWDTEIGYPYDTTVRDSDGDPVTPPLAVLDRLIDYWREHEVLPDTDETRDNYRDSFATEIGRDPWEATPATPSSSPRTPTDGAEG